MLLLVAMSLGIGEAKSETVKNVKYMGWDDTQKKLVEMTTPCDGAKKVSELLPSGVNFADVYFFGLSGNSFKRVLLGSDDVHPAGTCFLFISKDDFNNPPSSAPAGVRGIGIETDGTTSLIGNGQLTTDHAASAQW